MAGRTRLYQQAKSPLIQGRSKHERPPWQSWLAATLLGGLSAVGLVAAYLYLATAPSSDVDLLPLGLAIMTPYSLGGSALGALVAVWLAEHMGWRNRRLLGATITAGVVGLVGIGLSLYVGGRFLA